MTQPVFTLCSNTFGEPRLIGVYGNAKALLIGLEHLLDIADPDDEYRIEYAPVSTVKQEKEKLANCRRARLERLAEQEAEPAATPS